MAVAAKESLQQRTTALDSAIEDANYAVANNKNLRNLEKRRTELEAAWLSYQQAFEYHQLKVTDEEARTAAQQARRLQRNSSDEALEGLEELIEAKQDETGKVGSEEADDMAGKLAKAQVKGANEEVDRRLSNFRGPTEDIIHYFTLMSSELHYLDIILKIENLH